MDGKIVLFAPLPDSEAAGLLVRETGTPLIEKSLMDKLFGFHGITSWMKRIVRIARFELFQSIIAEMCYYKQVRAIEDLHFSGKMTRKHQQ